MGSDPRLRLRLLLLLLSGALAWLAWSERGAATAALETRRAAEAQAARADAAAGREESQRTQLLGVAQRLAERDPPPASAADLRSALVRVAGEAGVELNASRLQPLQRPPAGAAGSEARITALGDPGALTHYLAEVESRGWPLRVERADLAVRGGIGTLTASVTALWPDPEAPFAEADASRLAANPRLSELADWLDGTNRAAPEAAPVAAVRPEPAVTPSTAPAPAAEVADSAPAPNPTDDRPRLHGFVDPGGGAPVAAAVFFGGETHLVSVGDRLGEYTVEELEPSESVLLTRPDHPPLHLVLRP